MPGRLRSAFTLFAFAAASSCGPSTADWVKDLRHSDPFRRVMAAAALGEARPDEAPRVVPALTRALQRQDIAFRTQVIASIARQAPATLPVLAEAERAHVRGIDFRESGLREALSLCRDRTLPALVARLGAAERDEEDPALALLPYFGRAAVEVVRERLSDPSARTRARAARVLGEIGAPAHPAISALEHRLEDADPAVQREAERALERILPGYRRR